jgi:hypothetical protein
MTSQPDQRREASIQHQPASSAANRAAGGEMPPDVLREIVAETSARLAKPEEIDPALRAALVEVARRFAGQPMTLDPAATALLEAVLRLQFPALAQRPALLTQTARTVASSLLADPAARLRVEHLWGTLAEDAP